MKGVNPNGSSKNQSGTKAKIVYQMQGDGAENVQTSRTFSNLVANVTDDALHAGMSAVAGLMDGTGHALVRVDEATLVSE